MRFKVESSSWDTDKMLANYPCLVNYGLKIATAFDEHFEKVTHMEAYIEIDDLEQLLQFEKDITSYGNDDWYPGIILWADHDTIEIYDGYRE